MCKPKVSVIMPVYNNPAHLREAAESVLGQDIESLELIMINDGSDDESVDIMRTLMESDERVVVCDQKERRGRSTSQNVGIEHARGEFLFFMNSMDVLHGGALRRAYEKCRARHLDLVFFDGEADGGECDEYHHTAPYDEITIYRGLNLLSDMFSQGVYRPAPWLMLISSALVGQTGIRFYPGIVHADELFTILIYINADRAGCLKASLITHRKIPGFTMDRVSSLYDAQCYITVVDELKAHSGRLPYLRPIVNKYASLCIGRLFSQARGLSLADKFRLRGCCASRGYLRYVPLSSRLLFWMP